MALIQRHSYGVCPVEHLSSLSIKFVVKHNLVRQDNGEYFYADLVSKYRFRLLDNRVYIARALCN